MTKYNFRTGDRVIRNSNAPCEIPEGSRGTLIDMEGSAYPFCLVQWDDPMDCGYEHNYYDNVWGVNMVDLDPELPEIEDDPDVIPFPSFTDTAQIHFIPCDEEEEDTFDPIVDFVVSLTELKALHPSGSSGSIQIHVGPDVIIEIKN